MAVGKGPGRAGNGGWQGHKISHYLEVWWFRHGGYGLSYARVRGRCLYLCGRPPVRGIRRVKLSVQMG